MPPFDPTKEYTPEELAILFPEIAKQEQQEQQHNLFFDSSKHYTPEELKMLKDTPFAGRGLETYSKSKAEKRLKETPTMSEKIASNKAFNKRMLAERGESGIGEHVWNNVKKRWEKIKSIPDYIDFAMKNPDTPAGEKIITDIAGWTAGGGFAAGAGGIAKSAIKGAATDGSTTLGMNIGGRGARQRAAKGDTQFIHTLTKAKQREKRGGTRDEIYDATGWWKNADNQWRFEIDDSSMRIKVGAKEDPVPITTSTRPESKFDVGKSHHLDAKFMHGQSFKLNEVINHPELFETYPFLNNIIVKFSDRELLGHASVSDLGIRIGTKVDDTFLRQGEIDSGLYHTLSEFKYKEIIAHEVQHIIQKEEGFSRGGSPESFLKGIKKTRETLLEQGEDVVTGINRQSAIARLRILQNLKKKGFNSEDMLNSRVGVQDLAHHHVLHMPNGKKFLAEDLGVTNAQLLQSGDIHAVANVKKRTWDEDIMKRVVQGLKHETKDTDKTMQQYFLLAGEVEARQTGMDVNLKMWERQRMRPWERPQTTSKHDPFYKEKEWQEPANEFTIPGSKSPEEKQIHFEKDYEGGAHKVETPQRDVIKMLDKLKFGNKDLPKA